MTPTKKPSKRLGRPSQGRSVSLQARITPAQSAWLEAQKQPTDKGMSDVIFRLLQEWMNA